VRTSTRRGSRLIRRIPGRWLGLIEYAIASSDVVALYMSSAALETLVGTGSTLGQELTIARQFSSTHPSRSFRIVGVVLRNAIHALL
jgi:hypothetical protein